MLQIRLLVLCSLGVMEGGWRALSGGEASKGVWALKASASGQGVGAGCRGAVGASRERVVSPLLKKSGGEEGEV